MQQTWIRILAALTAVSLFATLGFAQSQKQGRSEEPPEFKQIRLTERQVQNFVAVQKDLAPLSKRLEAAGDKPDPRLQAELEQVAKKNGFANLDELDAVAANVSFVLSGLDPQSGTFTEPSEMIRRDMDQLKQEKRMPQKERDKALAEMQQALRTAPQLQFKENVAVVKKYQKQLDQIFQETDRQERGGQEPGRQEPSRQEPGRQERPRR